MAAANRDANDDEVLNPAARWVSGLLGGLLIVAGALAVFASGRDLGPSVLIIVGGVFLLMAISGRAVVGVRIGNSELKMQEKVHAARLALSEGRDDQALQLLTEVDKVSPRSVITGLTPTEYEEAVFSALQTVLPQALVERQAGPRDLGFDGIVRLNGKVIVVEVFMGTLFTGRRFAASLGRALSAEKPVDGLLVVINGIPRAVGMDRIRQAAKRGGIEVQQVVWLPSDSPQILGEAVLQLANG